MFLFSINKNISKNIFQAFKFSYMKLKLHAISIASMYVDYVLYSTIVHLLLILQVSRTIPIEFKTNFKNH